MKCLCYIHNVNFLNCNEKTSLHLSFSQSLNSSNFIHFIPLQLYNLFNYSSPSHSFVRLISVSVYLYVVHVSCIYFSITHFIIVTYSFA